MSKLLGPSSALLWGLQLAFLSPALALILVNLYGATTAEVGWVLGIYNASGFIASLLLPAYADKKHDYLGPMLVCGALTLLLAVVLALATTLPIATIALVVIGGPAGVGSSMLFAHLRHSGARPSDIINTRAIVSVAWVAGPPLATFIIGWFGNRAILLAIAAVAVLNIATTAIMIRHRRAAARSAAAGGAQPPSAAATPDESPVGRLGVVLIMAAFILLQATNATAMTIMTVYVTDTLQLNVMWAGIALGVAAALEVPALLLIGRLSNRFSHLSLIATSCLAGITYYVGLMFVTEPILLIALQPLNAWSFAGIAGIGLPLFQQMIPQPGLSTGLYMNTRRLGAIVSGPIIAIGSLTVLGQRGIFLTSAVLTLISLAIIGVANRTTARAAHAIDYLHRPEQSPRHTKHSGSKRTGSTKSGPMLTDRIRTSVRCGSLRRPRRSPYGRLARIPTKRRIRDERADRELFPEQRRSNSQSRVRHVASQGR